MSQRLISLNPDLSRLRADGYDVHVRGAFLEMRDVPYVDSSKNVRRGALISELNVTGEAIEAPSTHVMHFNGGYPCDRDGVELAKIRHQVTNKPLLKDLLSSFSFSSKPVGGAKYPDFYTKFTSYVAIVSGPAGQIDPGATARTFPVVVPDEDTPSPFEYLDTASTRAQISAVTQKLEGHVVAIIGLGGTGSYVLDFLAKTPVKQIHLFDGDVFSQHNAFRSPGAPSIPDLALKASKVNYLGGIYSRMHRGVVPHSYRIGEANLEELGTMGVVFVCVDDGPSKRVLFPYLESRGIPFIDVGMGVDLVDGALTGILRTTTSTPAKRDHIWKMVSVGVAPSDDYNRNIQVAELNALNAALAVARWKRLLGFYQDLSHEHHSAYAIDGNHLVNDVVG